MSPLFKKSLSLVVLASLFLSTGFGCKAPTAAEQAAIRPVKLNYWTVYGDVSELRRLAFEYQKMFPQVSINIRQIRYEEYDKLFTNALADDVGPDIISTHIRTLKKYDSRLSPMPAKVTVAHSEVQGQYAKETVIITEDKQLPTLQSIRDNYVSGVAEDVIQGTQVFGLPLSYDTLALYYNKTLLDQAGIATAPTTWDELVKAVKDATKYDADNKIIQSGIALGAGKSIDNGADILAYLVMQNGFDMTRGGSVVFSQGLDKNTLRNHPTSKALNFYSNFAREDKDVYSWNKNLGTAFESFVRNKSVFYFGYAYDYARIKTRNPQMTLVSIPLPQLNPNKPVNIANYWVESVVKKSKNKNYAWDFIRFITLPNNIKQYNVAAKVPSPLREHVGIQKQDPILATFANQSLTAKNWYHGREWETAKAGLQDMMDAYIVPYKEGEVGEAADERDLNIIMRAARTVQLTM